VVRTVAKEIVFTTHTLRGTSWG